ncbi:hypothetical protein G6F57_004124 [Rhizopus arrhizus]|uniref:Uncharacterized protein n=1 Tax=Rhizopus oryzae TaxID=64495 RepID=A0A9P7BVD8_RHIOR|nr:hypothetical protein G6F30_001350 [Rhizopus arrhizus]KAG0983817.1 hypothetical protein G6F29_005234 [Rhizopus arrhizus]KAG0996283.1 hypothetical protein G6F28_003991 [Rhizopus arrhizus]KAG1009516.1 hypothetical protein G6F27_005508 [Rhizopus arrhizus]KAG1029163.1 hypothetical protein G6F26_001965 [Rhizopus arrhizus]
MLTLGQASCLVLGYKPNDPEERKKAKEHLEKSGLIAVHIRNHDPFQPLAIGINVHYFQKLKSHFCTRARLLQIHKLSRFSNNAMYRFSVNQLQYWIRQAKIWGKSERSRKNQRKPGRNLWVVDEQLRAFVTDTSDSVKAYWKYLQHDTKYITIGYALNGEQTILPWKVRRRIREPNLQSRPTNIRKRLAKAG